MKLIGRLVCAVAIGMACLAGPVLGAPDGLWPVKVAEVQPFEPVGPDLDQAIHDLVFLSETRGHIVGGKGLVARTEDGGLTWLKQPSGLGEELRAVAFTAENDGWIAGDKGVVLHTTNGGASWNRIDLGVQVPLHDVLFTSSTTGFICGDQGTLFATKDSGVTWNRIPVEGNPPLHGLCLSPSGGLWMVGGKSVTYETRFGRYVEIFSRLTQKRQPSAVFLSNDNGATWTRFVPPTKVPLFGAASPDGQTLMAVGADIRFSRDWLKGKVPNVGGTALLVTHDGGRTWQEPRIEQNFNGSLTDVRPVDAQEGWAVGFHHQPSPPLVPLPIPMDLPNLAAYLHTMDGGTTWKRIEWYPSVLATSLYFIDRNLGWAGGPQGQVVRYRPLWYPTRLYNQGQKEQALQALERLAEQPSAAVSTLEMLAMLQARMGRWEAVEKTAQRILQAAPQHTYALFVQGVGRLEANQPEAAEELLRAAIAGDKNLAEAYYLLGKLRLNETPNLAVPYLQRYLVLKPDGPLAAEVKSLIPPAR